MKTKTSDLIGPALDWAVAEAEGEKPRVHMVAHGRRWTGIWLTAGEYSRCPSYSTDWAQGGPILTEARISRVIDHSGQWIAYWTDGYDASDAGKKWMQCDRNELVAGLRCYVASKLGDEVDVPDGLL